MTNMSYCRWENTSRDLADCVGTFEEWETEGKPETLSSEYEVAGFEACLRYARELIELAESNVGIVEAIVEQAR